MNERILLSGRGIARRWGGLVAVNKVSLDLERASARHPDRRSRLPQGAGALRPRGGAAECSAALRENSQLAGYLGV